MDNSIPIIAAREALLAYLREEANQGRYIHAGDVKFHFFPPQQSFSRDDLHHAIWLEIDAGRIRLDEDLSLVPTNDADNEA